ncbi:MAG: DUF2188 domain-containing protein [Rubrobacteraceae bacterium]
MRTLARGKGSSRRKTYHITKRSGGGWGVKRAGAKQASSKHRTQAAAIRAARRRAKSRRRGQVVVHRRNGRIRTEYTYGADPRSSKG